MMNEEKENPWQGIPERFRGYHRRFRSPGFLHKKQFMRLREQHEARIQEAAAEEGMWGGGDSEYIAGLEAELQSLKVTMEDLRRRLEQVERVRG